MTIAAYLVGMTKERVAEDIVTLDVLSGGRIDVGIGKGGLFKVQYDSSQVPPEKSRDLTNFRKKSPSSNV